MRFLSPGFLFALLTIAIPVIIHLFNFRKFKKVYFSNVRFLKFVQLQSSSRQQLKDRVILASRILALIFLVFAFARPYIPNSSQENAFQQQVVSVFIDNSYSMETVNKEGTLLDEAKRRAKEIASAYSLNDKFQLLTNDFEGKYQRLLNPDEFRNAVDEVRISSAHRKLDQILGRQQDIFLKEPNSRKTVYLISDFQENILPAASVSGVDSNVNVRLVRLKANAQPNISVDSVWFPTAIHKPGDAEKVIVRLRNNSDQVAENIPIRLTINEQQKALGSLTIQARGSSVDTLSFSGLKSGWQQAEIQITDFPVIFDDKFYFSFNVKKNLPLLIINGTSGNEYLNAVYRSDPFFLTNNLSAGNINYSALNNYPLIILNEVGEISPGLIQQLRAYVSRGGSLMIFPDLESLDPLKSLLQSVGADIPLELVSSESRVSSIDLQHPVFKGVFEHVPQKLDLPLVNKYIRYSSQNRTNRQNLLELPGKTAFFSEYRLGSGKVYLSAVPLKAEASNFVRHSVFVPIMYQTALLSLRDQDLYYKLNREQMIELPKITLNSNQTLKLRRDKFEAIPDLRQNENMSNLYVADQIRQSGNYQLFKNDSLLAVLSFNDSGEESNLTYASDKQIGAKFGDQKVNFIDSNTASIQNAVKSINKGTSLWKFCLTLALIFLAVEILLIRFYKKNNTKPVLN